MKKYLYIYQKKEVSKVLTVAQKINSLTKGLKGMLFKHRKMFFFNKKNVC